MEQYQCKMNEQEKLTDLLSTQKYLTSMYNAYCCEAATPSVKSSLLSILQDEHRIQEEIFHEMNTRGYYPLEKAEETKLNATKQKFVQKATV
ncbi:MAG: spore coat protein [Clostridia bacterium]|nr:spore coat protein [Clostridia bacterium]